MSRHNQRAESPSLVIPGAGGIPSIFDLSSLPSDTPRGRGTGHGGDDLSLSDLSLANARASAENEGSRNQWDDDEDDYELNPPLQLLNETPAPKRVMPEPEDDPEEPEEYGEDDGDMTLSQLGRSSRRNESVLDEGEMSIRTPQRNTRNMPESPPPSVYSRSRTAAERREEQLHAALFQLRKINSVLGDYVGALEAVDANTERLERQVERTNAILDRYVRMLDQQEQTSKLVFDEEWRGGEADEQTIQERIAQQAKLERERKEREERERQEREEREREEAERVLAEQEARERAAKSTSTARGRGNRGTVTRGTVARGRGAAGTTAAGRGTSSTSGTSSRIARPSSVSSTRGGIPRARGRGAA
ncbi:DASH complex subunit Duo1, partial [Rhizoctonia solani]